MKNPKEHLENMDQFVWHQCKQTAELACTKMIQTANFQIYLYFRPGKLLPAFDRPEGYELAINQRLPPNLTPDQLKVWIHERIGRVPFLPLN